MTLLSSFMEYCRTAVERSKVGSSALCVTLRPRGSRLLTAYSHKLSRTVRAFDHSAFEQWVRLEVDPSVVSFCEHPCRVGAADDGALIDFWLGRSGQEEMLVVERGQGSAKRLCRNQPDE